MDIVVVEDTLTVRTILVALLEQQGHHRVVAAVERVEEATAFLSEQCADLVILDLCLPGLSYDQAVKAVKTANPNLDILVFTVSEEDEKVFSSLKAGADGYILKSAKDQEILAAVEEIGAGGSPMSPSIARKVLREFQGSPAPEELNSVISPLSAREIGILELLYRGLNINELADRLFISPHTVQTHIKKIYSKLHVNTRSQAIYEAVQQNLIRA